MKKLLDALSSPRRSTRDLSLNILFTLALATFFTVINPNFMDSSNLISIGQNVAPYAMLALGVIMPISMGGTDLSVGAVCIGSAVVGGTFLNLGVPLAACIPIMIAFGGLVGLVNGYLIARKKLQPFIATLGSMMFVRGATAIFANTSSVLFPAGCWYNHLFSTWKGIPVSFAWILLFAGIMYFVYRKTRTGRYLLSIGSNEKAARISAIDVDKYIILGYIGSGLMAGVASIFYSASFTTITVATGNGMELDAIAAVYIGGTAATGGLVNVFGSVIGSIMLVVIDSGLNYALAKLDISINSTYVTYVISGIIVVAAVIADKGKRGGRKAADPRKLAVRRVIRYGISAGLVLFLVLFGYSLKQQSAESSGSSDTACLLTKSSGSEFWTSVEEGGEAACSDTGYRLYCRGSEGEDATYLSEQRQILNTMLSENPAGIAISAVSDGFTDLLESAYAKGVPIIQYDTGLCSADLAYITASSSNPLRSYVKADNYENAAMVAEYVFQAVKEDIAAASGGYTVGIIQHSTTTAASDRASGFAETFEKLAEEDTKTAGKCKIVTEIKPSDADNAYKDALEYLYEKGARLIFCSNLTAINQCSDAVQAADGKYDGVKFAGYDDGTKVRQWLNAESKSPLLASVSQNPYMMGYLAAKTIADLAEGREVAEEITVEGELLTPGEDSDS